MSITRINPLPVIWRRSTRSASGADQNCVEAGVRADSVVVRDSKFIAAGTLTTEPVAWNALLGAIKHGDFDC